MDFLFKNSFLFEKILVPLHDFRLISKTNKQKYKQIIML